MSEASTEQTVPTGSTVPTVRAPDGGGQGSHAERRPGWVGRFLSARGRVRRSRGGTVTWKVAVTAVSVVVIIAGIVMLAVPGPGWATILLGLAILSTEFEWAARWRRAVVRWLTSAAHRVRGFPRWLRVVSWVLVAVCLVALMYATLVVVGVPEWVPEGPREAVRDWPLVRG
jgi:uncharacterized protein (TIGR02611 family)